MLEPVIHPSNLPLFNFISIFSRCGHCKKLAPEFEKAATRLKGTVQLAKVHQLEKDCHCTSFSSMF